MRQSIASVSWFSGDDPRDIRTLAYMPIYWSATWPSRNKITCAVVVDALELVTAMTTALICAS